MPKKNIADLNTMYNDAESYFQDLFAEQRSNILLIAGDHYTRKGSKFWNAIRSRETVSRDQKLRLTKNHLQKITKSYVNNINTLSPSTMISPANESEVQDVKSAELDNSVWEHVKKDSNVNKGNFQGFNHFVKIGEWFQKITWDENKGDFAGYEMIVDELGFPKFDRDGAVLHKATFKGKLNFENYLGFNTLVDPSARLFDDARYVILRKMLVTKDLKDQYKDQDDKLDKITESSKQTFKLFDKNRGTYSDSKGMTMVREYYFRPSRIYPNGYFYLTTEDIILEQGELPLGIFPIIHCGFDEAETSSRSYSIIKQLRPCQAEINRCASKIAEHQTTIGDDKIIVQNGSSISAGGLAHGIKTIKVTGSAPTIMPGRNGSQFVDYMQNQITEMYNLSNVQEDTQLKQSVQDPYIMLFASIKEKKVFSLYAEKIQTMLTEQCELALKLCKAYMTEDQIIPIIGKEEQVNIQEFKNNIKLKYKVKVNPATDDLSSVMGKQLAFNHVLQYAGSNLPPSVLGKILQSSPYLNEKNILGELSLDSDNAENDILALDRGEFPEPHPEENHAYMIQQLTNRMKKQDFRLLDPQIQQMYYQSREAHTQMEKEKLMAEQMATQGFIPTGGHLVSIDMYVSDPKDPTKQAKRLRLPYDSLNDLMKKLEGQGSSLAELEQVGDDQTVTQDLVQGGLGADQRQPAPQY